MLTIRPRFHSYKCIFFEGNIWLYTCRGDSPNKKHIT
jgi:hypothetical protein